MKDMMISRRAMLRATGAAAVAGGSLSLAGCDGSTPDDEAGTPTLSATTRSSTATTGPTSTEHSSAAAGGVLPSHAPRAGLPEPDLAATDSGVPAVYYAYPAKPAQLTTSPPLAGGSCTAMSVASPAPTPKDKNQFWQELDKRLGTSLSISYSPGGQYAAKLATTIAGGDLPDIIARLSLSRPPAVNKFLAAECEDLSPWLAGEAAAAYPNLAALPTASWASCVVDGKLYGVPYSVPVMSSQPQVRQDIFDARGISTRPADGNDFLGICKELTNETKNEWAFGSINHAATMVRQMLGAPNVWKVDDGRFTSAYSAPEYQDAISTVREMWSSGYFEPDAPTATFSQITNTWFPGGRVAIVYGGYGTWSTLTSSVAPQNPTFEMGGLLMPKWSGGGQAPFAQNSPATAFTALKRANSDKIKSVLSVLDWIAAPFGSAEFLFARYGLPGRDYTLKGADPVFTPTGVSEVQAMSLVNLVRTLIPIYIPTYEKVAQAEYTFLSELMKVSTPLPTVGLFSQTESEKGASLARSLTQLETDIVLGRKPVSAWDGGVKTWLSSGGQTIAEEYEKSYSQTHS